MPDKPEVPGPSNPLYYLIAIVVLAFLVWLYTGGPNRYESEHPDIPPPTGAELGLPQASTSTVQ